MIPGGTRPARVLVVDDVAPLARTIARLLRRRGYVVAVARSTEEADQFVADFDLGVFDIDLGTESGVDLARRFLAAGRTARAVFFTGGDDPVPLEAAARLGPVLKKRDGIDSLVDFVDTVLQVGEALAVSASKISAGE